MPNCALLVAALMLGSCSGTEENAWVELRSDPTAAGPMVQITGTVVHSDLEGGLCLVRDAEGANYNSANLPEAFRVEGLTKDADAQRRDDLVSIGTVGPMVDVVRIRARSDRTASVYGTVIYRERLTHPTGCGRKGPAPRCLQAGCPHSHNRGGLCPYARPAGADSLRAALRPREIVEKHTYAVQAVIRSEGAVIFTSSSRYAVITRGNPSRVDLMRVRVGMTKARMEGLWGQLGSSKIWPVSVWWTGCKRRWCSTRMAR